MVNAALAIAALIAIAGVAIFWCLLYRTYFKQLRKDIVRDKLYPDNNKFQPTNIVYRQSNQMQI